MSFTLHKYPSNIVLSGNPVKIDVSSDTVTQSDHKIHVRIIKGGYIIGEEVLPVIVNSASFDISDYLKQHSTLDLSVFNLFSKTIMAADSLLSSFNVEIFETYNADGIEHNRTTIPQFKVLQAGFSTIFLNNYNSENKSFYSDFIQAEKKFLTWQPEKRLTDNQHDFLFFINRAFMPYNDIYARFTLYFSDDTTEVIDTATSNANFNSLNYINVSLIAHKFLNLETVNKTILKYDIVIHDTLHNAITETRTFYIDRDNYNQYRQFIYKNSIGAYDIIMLKGISESTDEIQRTIGYFQTKDIVGHSEFTESYSANSGFLVSQFKNAKQAKEYIIELVNSNQVFEIIGKELIPVISTQKKIKIVKDNELLYSFAFEYQYAYDDEFFAPFDSEQYIGAFTLYRNGIVTPEPAEPANMATLDFDVILNEAATLNFTINWGADVGITSINSEVFVAEVGKSLQSQISIPGNVDGPRTVTISDSIGGVYHVNYVVGASTILYNNGEDLLYNDAGTIEYNE